MHKFMLLACRVKASVLVLQSYADRDREADIMAGEAGVSSELRYDPIGNKWVIISPARGKRPTDLKSHGRPQASQGQGQGPCAFCLHHEHECAPEIFRIPDDTCHWRVRVIKNLYPAVSMDMAMVLSETSSSSSRLLRHGLHGFGSHDVVIESPDHSTPLAGLPVSSILDVLLAYRRRIQQLRSYACIKYIQVFKNHGDSAGASMKHSHSQIVALPIVPTNMTSRINNAKEFFTRTGKCILCESLRQEIQSGSLLIEESTHFIAFVPHAASFPFEIWIVPREHAPHYESIEDETAMDLALILTHMLQKLDYGLDGPPYNYMIHTSPIRELHEPSYCHWFIQVVPQLSHIGGFEIASGCRINQIFPEDAAKILREVKL